jgi:hypothetical protein
MTDRLPDPKPRDPTAAERQRRFRQRLKSRTVVASSVEVPVKVLEVMLDAGVISDQETQDGRMLGQALGRLFRRDLVVIKK